MIESFLLECLWFETVVQPWNGFLYSRGFVTRLGSLLSDCMHVSASVTVQSDGLSLTHCLGNGGVFCESRWSFV
jgi:hypothetical protein